MDNHPVYLKHILTLSDRQRLLTTVPITTDRGIKLVDRGVHLSASLYDKLVLHKIAPPVDECVSLADPLTLASLSVDLRAMLAAQPALAQFLGEDSRRCLDALANFPLSSLAAFKLSLLKAQLPEVYTHSLQVALLSDRLCPPALRKVSPLAAFAAGLFHDLGLLHIPPEILQRTGALTEPQLQQIYSHPITGHLILGRLGEWPAQVGQAILEHHERLDGSGYPKGLRDKEISLLGQLLGVAEVAATLLNRHHADHLAESLHVILRLNQDKLNRQLANQLVNLSQGLSSQTDASLPAPPAFADALGKLVQLSMHIQDWHTIIGHLGHLSSVDLINQRLVQLERNLAALGIDLQYWGMMDAELPGDTAAVRELAIAADEAGWQLKAIAYEVLRKWDKLCPTHQQVQAEIWSWAQRASAPHPAGVEAPAAAD